MASSFSVFYLTAACCSGYLVLGLIFSLIGVGLEAFATQTGASVAQIGSLYFLNIGGATFLMLLAVGPLIDRFGQKPILVSGGLICASSLWMLVSAHSLAVGCALMFTTGAGAACLNSGSNTLINHIHPKKPERMLNVGNLFFGVGAVIMPLAGSWLLAGPGISALLKLAAIGCLLPVILFSMAWFPSDVRMKDFRLADAGRAVNDPLVILFCALIFLYVGLEASMGVWSRPAVAGKWGLRPPLDQLLLAGYWGTIMLGRLLAGTLFHNIPGQKMVTRCAVGSLAGLVVFAFAENLYLAAAALWFSGLCFAPVFPSTLGSAGRVFTRYTGTILSLIIAASALGGIALSTLVGVIAGAGSMKAGLILVAGWASLMLLIQISISRRVKDRLKTSPAMAGEIEQI